MTRYFWKISSFIIGLFIAPAMYADVNGEREVLARIIHELQAVESLIDKAQAQADKDSRVRFEYRWLSQDLHQIKDGIQSHLNSPREQPRSFPPLRGDYRR